jgi:hypothetical protein
MSKQSSQFRWSRYFVALASNLAVFTVMIVIGWSVLAATGNPGGWWTTLLILACCLNALMYVARARRLIVAWQIGNQEIECRCLGRWKRLTCPLNEVSLSKWETHGRVIGHELHGSTIPRLWIDAGYLVDADELVQQLSARMPKCRKKLSGSLSQGELLLAILPNGFVIACLLCVALVGGLVIRSGWNSSGQQTWPFVALGVGFALICAGAIGIGFLLRALPPKVIRVDVSGDQILWWQLGWPFTQVRNCSEVVEVSVQQPPTRPVGMPSARFHVRFADGAAFDMYEATLPNAKSLAEMIGTATSKPVRDASCELGPPVAAPLAPIDEKLAKEMQVHLTPGERLLWAGRLKPEKLTIEYAAPIWTGIFILLAAVAFAGVMLAVMGWGAVCLISPVLCIFLAAGIWVMVYHGRENHRLQAALYGVTDQRAIIVGGLGFHGRDAYFIPHHECYSLFPDVVRDYRIEHEGRDIVFTSEWHRVRFRRRTRDVQVKIGFIAVDDPVGAMKALRRLTNQDDLLVLAPTGPISKSGRFMRDRGIGG